MGGNGVRAPRWQRAIVTAGCAYELVALWTDLPTITELNGRHPWIGAALVGAGIYHFYFES